MLGEPGPRSGLEGRRNRLHISNVFEHVAVAIGSKVAGLSAVGWMTLRLRKGAHVFAPAIGAGSAVLVFGTFQVALVSTDVRARGRMQRGACRGRPVMVAVCRLGNTRCEPSEFLSRFTTCDTKRPLAR